jgi:hypothetical protein
LKLKAIFCDFHQEILLQFFNNLSFFLVKVLEFFFCPPSSSLCLCDRLLLLQNFLICVFWACADSKAILVFHSLLTERRRKTLNGLKPAMEFNGAPRLMIVSDLDNTMVSLFSPMFWFSLFHHSMHVCIFGSKSFGV